MSYVRAEEILPQELIETIQQYVNGQIIYIPSLEKKEWGSRTDTRQYYANRNREICEKNLTGKTVQMLAEEYALSEKSIRRILKNRKEEREYVS